MTGKRAKLEERFEADVKSFGGGAEGKAKAVTKWEECACVCSTRAGGQLTRVWSSRQRLAEPAPDLRHPPGSWHLQLWGWS